MKSTLRMKTCSSICAILCVVGFCSYSLAVESGMFRLLSISNSEKLILVSQTLGKAKYLLDASSAKITVDGKPAEFNELKIYSVIQLKMERQKQSKNGIQIDGKATEIRVSHQEDSK